MAKSKAVKKKSSKAKKPLRVRRAAAKKACKGLMMHRGPLGGIYCKRVSANGNTYRVYRPRKKSKKSKANKSKAKKSKACKSKAKK